MRVGTRQVTPFTIEVLNVVEEFYTKNGYPPTLREVGEVLESNSTSAIRYAMDTLAQGGFLTEGVGGQSRTQVPTFKSRKDL